SALGIGEPLAERPRRPNAANGGGSLEVAPRPEDDVFLLGSLLYRSLTGQESGVRSQESGIRGRGISSVRQSVPEIPSMLADLLDSLVDPVPANRPKSAAAIAKSLRVLLKTEEEASLARVEEKVVVPVPSRGVLLVAAAEGDRASEVSYDLGQGGVDPAPSSPEAPPMAPPVALEDWRLT